LFLTNLQTTYLRLSIHITSHPCSFCFLGFFLVHRAFLGSYLSLPCSLPRQYTSHRFPNPSHRHIHYSCYHSCPLEWSRQLLFLNQSFLSGICRVRALRGHGECLGILVRAAKERLFIDQLLTLFLQVQSSLQSE